MLERQVEPCVVSVSEGLGNPEMGRASKVISASDLLNMDKLSKKQREAVELVAEGLTTSEIARKLGSSPTAIYTRIATASRLLNVSDRRALIRAVFPAHCTPQTPPPMREKPRFSAFADENEALHLYRIIERRLSPAARLTNAGTKVGRKRHTNVCVGPGSRISSRRTRSSGMTGDEFLERGAPLRQAQLTLQNQIEKVRRSKQKLDTSHLQQLMNDLEHATEELAALTQRFLTGGTSPAVVD